MSLPCLLKLSQLILWLILAYILDLVSYTWSPYKVHHIDKIDSVKNRFAKWLNGLQSHPYQVKLSKLSLDSLSYVLIWLMIFDIIRGSVEVDIPNIHRFSTSNFIKGNMSKSYTTYCKTEPELCSFPNRAVTAWNILSNNIIVSSKTSMSVKHSLKIVHLKECCRR